MIVPRPQRLLHVAFELVSHDWEVLKIERLRAPVVRRPPTRMPDGVGSVVASALMRRAKPWPLNSREPWLARTVANHACAGGAGMVPDRWLEPLQEIISNLIYHREWRGA